MVDIIILEIAIAPDIVSSEAAFFDVEAIYLGLR